MELLSSLNLEQLGTAGIMVAFLVWKNIQLEKAVEKATERSFDTLKEANASALENSRTLDKVLTALGGQ
jgi:hypothetical protein